MKRIVLRLLVAALVAGSAALAHHGYAAYDRNATVTMEGNVKNVLWANPHVVLTLDTGSQGDYSIEWAAMSQLARQGITEQPVKAGDHLIITGSINKDPTVKILTILREIRRPSDGWQWTAPNLASGAASK